MEGFGASAPDDVLYEHFGITPEAIVAKVRNPLISHPRWLDCKTGCQRLEKQQRSHLESSNTIEKQTITQSETSKMTAELRAELTAQIEEMRPWHHDIELFDEFSTGKVFSPDGRLTVQKTTGSA